MTDIISLTEREVREIQIFRTLKVYDQCCLAQLKESVQDLSMRLEEASESLSNKEDKKVVDQRLQRVSYALLVLFEGYAVQQAIKKGD